jgi:hypothetical protein
MYFDGDFECHYSCYPNFFLSDSSFLWIVLCGRCFATTILSWTVFSLILEYLWMQDYQKISLFHDLLAIGQHYIDTRPLCHAVDIELTSTKRLLLCHAAKKLKYKWFYTLCMYCSCGETSSTQDNSEKTAVGQKEIRITRVMTFKVTIKIHHDFNFFAAWQSNRRFVDVSSISTAWQSGLVSM